VPAGTWAAAQAEHFSGGLNSLYLFLPHPWDTSWAQTQQWMGTPGTGGTWDPGTRGHEFQAIPGYMLTLSLGKRSTGTSRQQSGQIWGIPGMGTQDSHKWHFEDGSWVTGIVQCPVGCHEAHRGCGQTPVILAVGVERSQPASEPQ
jgi:hypothetical protein